MAGRASDVECFGGREPPETVTLQVPRGREPREPPNEGRQGHPNDPRIVS